MNDSQGSLKFENTYGQLIVEGSKVKVVAQGEDSVGKTSVLLSLTEPAACDWDTQTWNDQVEPKMVKSNRAITWRNCLIDFEVEFWDTVGQGQNMKALRTLSYHDTDIFLLAFDMTRPSTLDGLPDWVEEFRDVEPDAAVVVVGCKADLWREGRQCVSDGKFTAEGGGALSDEDRLSLQEMRQVAVDIGAHGFVTTSACDSEAFLCSSACSKDGGDGTCLKNVILELAALQCDDIPMMTLCEQDLWLPWRNDISRALALGSADKASSLYALHGEEKILGQIWSYVTSSKQKMLPMLLLAATQRESEAYARSQRATKSSIDTKKKVQCVTVGDEAAKDDDDHHAIDEMKNNDDKAGCKCVIS